MAIMLVYSVQVHGFVLQVRPHGRCRGDSNVAQSITIGMHLKALDSCTYGIFYTCSYATRTYRTPTMRVRRRALHHLRDGQGQTGGLKYFRRNAKSIKFMANPSESEKPRPTDEKPVFFADFAFFVSGGNLPAGTLRIFVYIKSIIQIGPGTIAVGS